MNIRSILAVTDLSAHGNRTVERAALLAVEHDALLKMMYAPAAGGLRVDAAGSLAKLSSEVAATHGVLVKNVAKAAERLEDVVDEASWVDLVVLEHAYERTATAFFHGQPFERLLRLAGCPVLVTRLPARTKYTRILVAVNFTPAAKDLVKLASSLNSAAEVEVFHALVSGLTEGKLRYASVSEDIIKSYRQECTRQALDGMRWLTDSWDARRNHLRSTIGHGDPARQTATQQQCTMAELLVVGKRKSSALQDFIFGSMAKRVLERSTGDVLIVPHDARASTRAVDMPGSALAKERMREAPLRIGKEAL
ncbi:universal stress protein [Variovorax guangxiensis]|uniref:universal stress protein n=1 Tax=Variovorax guangxiensis TaxID=1775474 RepID=UPI0028586B10|nr:universal stress protein [Variovorax guangxiensis]MDR6860562.1 nucleotide-binding universal stress UspA family protein [Variovorax guangxiensis]